MKTTPIKVSVFQNKATKRYKWLSLENATGEITRYIYESGTDSTDPPSQTPSDALFKPGSFVDYENAVHRIRDSGYDIVTQL